MNIKSELINKQLKWFPNITSGMILISVLMSIILALIIVSLGCASAFKILFILIGSIIVLIHSYDTTNKSSESPDVLAKKGGIMIIMTILICELSLSIYARKHEIIPVKAIIVDKVRTINIKQDDKSDAFESKTEPYKEIVYYDLNRNDIIHRAILDTNMINDLDFITSITGKEIYIDYIPFLKFSEEYRYIRE